MLRASWYDYMIGHQMHSRVGTTTARSFLSRLLRNRLRVPLQNAHCHRMRATDDDRLGPVQVDRKCDTCRSSNQRRRRPRNDAQNKPQHPSGRDEAPIRGNSALPCSAQTGQEDETQASRPRPSPPPVSSMKGKTTPPPSREKSGELCLSRAQGQAADERRLFWDDFYNDVPRREDRGRWRRRRVIGTYNESHASLQTSSPPPRFFVF